MAQTKRVTPEIPASHPDPLWQVTLDGFSVDRFRVDGSLFCLADGCIGTSGAPMAFHPGLYRYVVASGVYTGDGPETHLLTAPVAMQLPYEFAARLAGSQVLDLRQGLLFEEALTSQGVLRTVRFSSLARPGTAVFRASCPNLKARVEPLLPPADDSPFDNGCDAEVTWMRVLGTPGGVSVAAVDRFVADGAQVTVDRVAVYDASGDSLPSKEDAITRVRSCVALGFEGLLAEHRRAWTERWEDADIVVEGDDDLQRSIRFGLFHLMGSVPDNGEAAVGARGLTGTSYSGHVFWDADTLTLPFLSATHPDSARAMLEYRIRRLPAARAAAAQLGRQGARFPWESAHSGMDVTPTSARDRTGKTVPIRTGQLEEHIVAQVAWAACCYIDWTSDTAFRRGPGLNLMIETARYWASRVREEPDGAHIYGVIGPDEYHEPVDDNAFTNVMARWNLRRAADAVLDEETDSQMTVEALRWRAVADRLVDGFDPDSGIYEQFAGFYRLEPLIVAEVAPRRPIAADLLLGHDRTSEAQVVKQADVLMLHHLVPHEVETGTLEPNLAFYEPRTAHGSSLSPGIHASLFARARQYDRALNALRMACRMDLEDLTASTSGGLHLATMGSVWQALVFGFAGVRPHGGRLVIDPRLPDSWTGIELRVRYQGHRTRLRLEHDQLSIETDGTIPLTVEGVEYDVGPQRLILERRRHTKEETAWRR